MQVLFRFAITIVAVVSLFVGFWGSPALADEAGAKIFSANCAACHAGGRNLVNAEKTLQKSALEKFGMNSADAIIKQVTNGKNGMPAFKGRLTEDQIASVAAYVLQQAEQGW